MFHFQIKIPARAMSDAVLRQYSEMAVVKKQGTAVNCSTSKDPVS